ncbi:MAG: SH3 domain-containing protein [Flavobacteriales bacterium]
MLRNALFLLLLPSAGLCQNDADVYFTPAGNYLMPEEAPMHYVLVNDLSMRAEPVATSALRSTLAIGAPVRIIDASEGITTINGIRSHWYRVDDGAQQGWIWGGYIATHAFGSTSDPTVKFLAGHERIGAMVDGGSGYRYRLVALRNGTELDRIGLRSFGHGFEDVVNLGNKGLGDIDDIIALHVPCVGGCGCSTGEVMVFWDEGRFHHAADLIGSPDGNYSFHTAFIFPSDMEGMPGTIIRVTSDVLEDDEDTEPEAEGVQRIFTKEYLRWNGNTLEPTGKRKVERKYFLRDPSAH